jgi:hypothetical protein
MRRQDTNHITLVDEDGVRLGQIDSHSTSTRTQQEDEDLLVIREAENLFINQSIDKFLNQPASHPPSQSTIQSIILPSIQPPSEPTIQPASYPSRNPNNQSSFSH